MKEYKKIYLCVTNKCNLCCKGCYMNSSISSKGSMLDLDIARSILNSNINEYDDVECVFHGGEPFFMKDDNTIQSYINLVKEYPNIKWSATTNLTYKITDKLFELFSLFYDKFIKTSWDVDNYRFTNDNQEKIWLNNVKCLLNKGFDVQVIVTLNIDTLKHDPSEILDYFERIGVKCINFERITETGRASFVKVKPFNADVDTWLKHAYLYNQKHHDVEIQLFKELEDVIKGNKPVGCRQRKCMENVITINCDGTVATCPNISNVHIIDSNGYNEQLHKCLIKHEQTVDQRCLVCQYYNICKGDCCQLKFDNTGCPGLKSVIKEIIRNLK